MNLELTQPRISSLGNASEIESTSRLGVLDNVERAIVLVFYVQMVVRMVWNAYQSASPAALLLLPSEGLVVILILLRRNANQMSLRWQDWVAAIGGTALPTLVMTTREQPSIFVVQIAAIIALMGLVVQIHAKFCLGRSFGIVAANRGIKSSGPYRFVRHPIYAGYATGQVAFLAMFPTVWNCVVLSLGLMLQIYRILVEENVLSQDKQYIDYKRRVRYRFIPGIV